MILDKSKIRKSRQEFVSATGIDEFRKIFSDESSFSKGLKSTVYRAIAFFVFDFLKMAESFLGINICFNSSSGDFSTYEKYMHHFLKTGLLDNFYKDTTNSYPDEPPCYRCMASLGSVLPYSDTKSQRCFFTGADSFDSYEHAFLKTLGEVAERFCLDSWRGSEMVKTSFKKLKKPAINPMMVASLLPEQRNSKELSLRENSIFRWVKGYSLKTGRKYFIPAQLVYVAYDFLENEPRIRIPISTGAAAGLSFEGAVYRGLCEVVERDAFIIFYLNKISAPRIDLENFPDQKIRDLLKLFKRYRLELTVLDITTDISVPVMLAIITDKSGVGPPLSIGARADLNIREAIKSAVGEATRVRRGSRLVSDRKQPHKKINPSRIITFDDRRLFWLNPALLKEVAFFFAGPLKKIKESDLQYNNENNAKKLDKVLEILNRLNLESFVSDIAIRQVKAAGFSVVKTVIPELQPLYLREDLRYFGGKRLYEVPVRMGWRKNRIKPEELNSIPHPFI